MWVKMADTATQRLAEGAENRDFYETKIKTAQFFFDKMMPQAYALEQSMKSGSRSLMDIAAEKFAHNQTTVGEKPRAAQAAAPAKSRKAGFFGW
jgi:hypothetical protein